MEVLVARSEVPVNRHVRSNVSATASAARLPSTYSRGDYLLFFANQVQTSNNKALALWIVEHLDDVACADRFSHGLAALPPFARSRPARSLWSLYLLL